MIDGPVRVDGGGVSLVLAHSPSGAPVVLHWGRDPGPTEPSDLDAAVAMRRPGVPHSALDHPRQASVSPLGTEGFTGTPTVVGHRPRGGTAAWDARWLTWTLEETPGRSGRQCLRSRDEEAGLALAWEVEVTEEGLVRARTTLTNLAPTPYAVTALRTVLPVPARASELLDLTGRWCRERSPQRHPWPQGTWSRAGRHGRTGHDATLLLLAGTPGFGFGHGEVWGVHVAWSGDHETYAERTPEGECLLGGGELLGPGEVVLDPGEEHRAPWLVGTWSEDGLDGAGDRLHRWVRRHSPRTRRPRPVVVNTWEATYFDHDLDRLTALADRAARVGAERFVLDDGWFRGRTHDRAGLGDWVVDAERWPEGLHPLVDHVRGLGLEFGLWVEPEMVNIDSRLAREHPDWLLRGRAELPDTWRHQQVLDLQQPAAYAHVRDALLALLSEYDIAFLKWDHNRDLVDVAHDGRPAVHGQTAAFYRLLDELHAAHPELEVESCASGGGRIDLGVLARTDRVWPSDTMDPLLRASIQRWTGLLVPPELLGAHVGGPVAHTTGRTSSLSFRAGVALLGHFGLEWDLTALDDEQLEEVAGWVALHREVRHLVGEGRLVRPDHRDPALLVTGLVAPAGDDAVFTVVVVDSTLTQHPAPVRLAGLRRDLRYRLRPVGPTGGRHVADLAAWSAAERETTGGVLMDLGVQLPVTAPETSYVWRLTAVDSSGSAT